MSDAIERLAWMQRACAKMDRLEAENAALRERVLRYETLIEKIQYGHKSVADGRTTVPYEYWKLVEMLKRFLAPTGNGGGR